MKKLSVAVVGGGITGASCAWRLAQSGHAVEVFDIGKMFPGGRASTRRIPGKAEAGIQKHQFDHGAQFLAAPSNPKCSPLIDELTAAGQLVAWSPKLAEVNSVTGLLKEAAGLKGGFFGALSASSLYVGSPSMSSVCSHLTSHAAIKLTLNTKVGTVSLDPETRKWSLSGRKSAKDTGYTELGDFDALVCTDVLCGTPGSPGFVTASGVTAAAAMKPFYDKVASLPRTPLFVMMLAYDTRNGKPVPQLPFDAACFSAGSSFAWLAKDSSKPGRSSKYTECWVAVSSEAFGAELLGVKPGTALPAQSAKYLAARAELMLAAARKDLTAAGLTLPDPTVISVHRWGSAYVSEALGLPCITEPGKSFFAAGDFCLGPGIENAMLSGLAAAEAVDAHASATQS